MHIGVFSSAQWAVAKKALEEAGHAEVASLKSNTLKFLSHLEEQFPDVYADIKKGVADYKDKDMSGGEKAVAVAEDVLKAATDTLKNVAGIKSALVAGVTTFFADEVADFKGIALETVANVAAGTTTSLADKFKH